MLAVLSEIVVRLEHISAAKPSGKVGSSLFQRAGHLHIIWGAVRLPASYQATLGRA